jgi:hypothetical protein
MYARVPPARVPPARVPPARAPTAHPAMRNRDSARPIHSHPLLRGNMWADVHRERKNAGAQRRASKPERTPRPSQREPNWRRRNPIGGSLWPECRGRTPRGKYRPSGRSFLRSCRVAGALPRPVALSPPSSKPLPPRCGPRKRRAPPCVFCMRTPARTGYPRPSDHAPHFHERKASDLDWRSRNARGSHCPDGEPVD